MLSIYKCHTCNTFKSGELYPQNYQNNTKISYKVGDDKQNNIKTTIKVGELHQNK